MLGSARLCSARVRSARLGSVRLGSARLGSARLGSARLGSARLGLATAHGTGASSVRPPGGGTASGVFLERRLIWDYEGRGSGRGAPDRWDQETPRCMPSRLGLLSFLHRSPLAPQGLEAEAGTTEATEVRAQPREFPGCQEALGGDASPWHCGRLCPAPDAAPGLCPCRPRTSGTAPSAAPPAAPVTRGASPAGPTERDWRGLCTFSLAGFTSLPRAVGVQSGRGQGASRPQAQHPPENAADLKTSVSFAERCCLPCF
ncbi:PREDICTED: uncharacterized protein LOC102015346 [Chinchilla lanigera]|uniref:uncharacterized protein LOC102015346 n=1 Tax=Chinchilla lanigera TaxID=34839 RepID=UPI0006991C25|nr:PREDICTED: uncharacterized protein LOC102015346 [Chinchilla lanigera]